MSPTKPNPLKQSPVTTSRKKKKEYINSAYFILLYINYLYITHLSLIFVVRAGGAGGNASDKKSLMKKLTARFTLIRSKKVANFDGDTARKAAIVIDRDFDL
jgi:hypothetical protein